MEDKIILKFKTKNILNFYEIEPWYTFYISHLLPLLMIKQPLRCQGIKSDALGVPFTFQKHMHIKKLPTKFSNILL